MFSSSRKGWVYTVRCRSVWSSKEEEEGCSPGIKACGRVLQHQNPNLAIDPHPIQTWRMVLNQQRQSTWAPAVFCSPTFKATSATWSMSTSPGLSVSPAPLAARPNRSEWLSRLPRPRLAYGKVSGAAHWNSSQRAKYIADGDVFLHEWLCCSVLKYLWCDCFRWVSLWESEQLGVEQHLSIPGQSLPSICLCLSPPRLLSQPCFLQPPWWSTVGRPHALPGQPPPSGCSPRQLDLQPDSPEFKWLPQCPQRLPSSPPYSHPAPPPHAPFIPNPQLSIGSQV